MRDFLVCAGATGNTGVRVVQQLHAKGYKVRAGIRDVAKAQKLGLDQLPGACGWEGGCTAGIWAMLHVTRTGASSAARDEWRKEGVALACSWVGGAGVTLVQADVTKGVARLKEAIGDAQAVVCATGARRPSSSPPPFRARQHVAALCC